MGPPRAKALIGAEGSSTNESGLGREMEYFVEPEEAFTRDDIEWRLAATGLSDVALAKSAERQCVVQQP